ncbi:MAG: N-acetylmuramic acid 6-phosphate etherase [Pseudomonadota bacterium]|jgi:N-acetylmuramic acid 6-phosphate etherase|nr:N-acetylmuramic acid 6-phosphate etherase [Rubrivivax sp.]MCA3258045.1 N-acetylmuramic acid 6-phosphate etherase [Rubrivivax sp.]MCE2912338.1 N-acetylmuramic acid 6-phosphate etherase [Rubrivivax sp.]MCZ8031361.1 N-acetylmuramic acid 6-phosphate etherase [Rubrivivax sp.]
MAASPPNPAPAPASVTEPFPVPPGVPLTTSPATEQPSERHAALDTCATPELVAAFVADPAGAAEAVRAAAVDPARAVDEAVPRLAAGGRLIYVGAGTSGRLGVLDAVELLPTFSWLRERARALLAGGEGAMVVTVEGAADDAQRSAADLAALAPSLDDVVLLIAASGTTPHVIGACGAARQAGSLTIGLVNNPGAPLAAAARLGILLDTGPEAISGSTRLKAGTAQKIALNSFSSSVMVRLHKIYGALMVDLRAASARLRRRMLALAMRASGADAARAQAALGACGARVQTAIVMLAACIDAAAADARLAACDGDVRRALCAAPAPPR